MISPLDIKLFGYYPGANCTKCQQFQGCGGKAHEWDFEDVKGSLLSTYGDRITVSLVNVFSDDVKSYPEVQDHIKKYGLRIPILMIDSEIIACGGEAGEDIIRKVVDFLLADPERSGDEAQ